MTEKMGMGKGGGGGDGCGKDRCVGGNGPEMAGMGKGGWEDGHGEDWCTIYHMEVQEKMGVGIAVWLPEMRCRGNNAVSTSTGFEASSKGQ